MDETDINDLANELMEDEDEDAKKKEAEDLKVKKKKARLAERLAAEKRKEEKAAKRQQSKKKTSTADDDDDVDGMATFARKKKNWARGIVREEQQSLEEQYWKNTRKSGQGTAGSMKVTQGERNAREYRKDFWTEII